MTWRFDHDSSRDGATCIDSAIEIARVNKARYTVCSLLFRHLDRVVHCRSGACLILRRLHLNGPIVCSTPANDHGPLRSCWGFVWSFAFSTVRVRYSYPSRYLLCTECGVYCYRDVAEPVLDDLGGRDLLPIVIVVPCCHPLIYPHLDWHARSTTHVRSAE